MQDHYIKDGDKHCSECDEAAALRSSLDHVVVSNVEGGHKFECLRCKHSYVHALPCSIDMFVTMSEQFVAEHKGCEAQP
jgi:hypothetical protein